MHWPLCIYAVVLMAGKLILLWHPSVGSVLTLLSVFNFLSHGSQVRAVGTCCRAQLTSLLRICIRRICVPRRVLLHIMPLSQLLSVTV